MGYPDEEANAKSNLFANFFAEGLEESAAFREAYKNNFRKLIPAEDMPMERSPNGLIKHLIHEKMNTAEMCIDAYMHFFEAGKASGKVRHLSEAIFFVVEGRGYDLHWDVQFDCKDEFEWRWASEPKRYDWQEGDFVYIPPYVTYQHFNADPDRSARIIMITSRIVKKMGFDWFEQVERAEGF